MHFAWSAPNRWVWMHSEAQSAGAITDGTTNVIVEDGVAILVTSEGEIGTTHRLFNLLSPGSFDYEGWEFGPVSTGVALGRSAWFFNATPSAPGKAPIEIAFDVESGVILFMQAEEFYLGFLEIALDEEIPDETFRWAGPVESQKVGQALVTLEKDGTYSVVWEVAVRGRPVFHQQGPVGVTRVVAVAWGQERATLRNF